MTGRYNRQSEIAKRFCAKMVQAGNAGLYGPSFLILVNLVFGALEQRNMYALNERI